MTVKVLVLSLMALTACKSTNSHSPSSSDTNSNATALAPTSEPRTMDKEEQIFSQSTHLTAKDKRIENMIAQCAFSDSDIPKKLGFDANDVALSVAYDRASAEQGILLVTSMNLRLRPSIEATFSFADEGSDLTGKFAGNDAGTENPSPAAKKSNLIWDSVVVRGVNPEGLSLKFAGKFDDDSFTAYCSGNGEPADDASVTASAAP